jgi:acetyltransferase-like isoleucine patch superfamily enzyme
LEASRSEAAARKSRFLKLVSPSRALQIPLISAHMFRNGELYLPPIFIGKGCEIGAHVLVNAGAPVGDGAVVGIRAHIRRGYECRRRPG